MNVPALPTPADELPAPLQQIDRTMVRHRGRKLVYFGGCDYYRLASHPAVIAAVNAGLRRYGLNVSASRKTTGNHVLYELLEQKLAKFFGAPRAVVVGSGYQTNLAVAQALQGEFAHAFVDVRAHPSLKDAGTWLGCPVHLFQHRDSADLLRVWQAAGKPPQALVLTDGLFAHDGSVAPLREYAQALPPTVLFLVDDAHGAAILGRRGRGTPEHEGLNRERVIQTITLSKAFGVYGGAILSSRALASKILTRSALFAGQTPLPLPLVCGALKALDLLTKGAALRKRLAQKTQVIKSNLRNAGISCVATPSPIIQVVPRDARAASRLRKALLARSIYPSLIRYPGGPPAGYYRFAISSEHTRAQLAALAAALCAAHLA